MKKSADRYIDSCDPLSRPKGGFPLALETFSATGKVLEPRTEHPFAQALLTRLNLCKWTRATMFRKTITIVRYRYSASCPSFPCCCRWDRTRVALARRCPHFHSHSHSHITCTLHAQQKKQKTVATTMLCKLHAVIFVRFRALLVMVVSERRVVYCSNSWRRSLLRITIPQWVRVWCHVCMCACEWCLLWRGCEVCMCHDKALYAKKYIVLLASLLYFGCCYQSIDVCRFVISACRNFFFCFVNIKYY